MGSDGGRSAIHAIARSWPAFSTTEGARLRALIETVPHAEWSNDPWLIAAMGASYRSLGSTSRSASLPYFRTAERLLAADTTAPMELVAGVNLHYAAALRSLGKLDSALARAQAAWTALDGDVALRPGLRVRLQSKVALQLGIIQLHGGDYETAGQNLRLALGLSEQNLLPAEMVECFAGLAFLGYTSGDFARATEFAGRARDASGDSGLLSSGFGAAALITELLVAIEQDRQPDALALADEVTSAAYRTDWQPLAHYARGSVAVISGRYIEGLGELQNAHSAARGWEGAPIVRTMSEGMRGVFYLHLGELDEAESIIRVIEPTQNHANCPGRFLASIRFASGDPAGCLEALRDCEALGHNHSNRTMIDVMLLSAAANYELGRPGVADIAFDRALLFSAQRRMRTPFLLVPAVTMQAMLTRAARRNQPAQVREILEGMRGGRGAPLASAISPPSDRERVIAAHLALEKTIGQIAADLFISSNTVKTHVRNIYRKLQATDRSDAIRRVKELGIHREITPD